MYKNYFFWKTLLFPMLLVQRVGNVHNSRRFHIPRQPWTAAQEVGLVNFHFWFCFLPLSKPLETFLKRSKQLIHAATLIAVFLLVIILNSQFCLLLLLNFRWEGPISIAVYAPGSDLEDAIDSILYHRFGFDTTTPTPTPPPPPLSSKLTLYSRDCTNSTLVRDLATFHIFFDFAHTPDQVFSLLF